MKDTLSAIDEDILTLLEGRMLYAYEALGMINKGRRSPLQSGSLYPAINRLELKGFVGWVWGEEKSGGGRRKYISVTEEGAAILQQTRKYRANLAKR